MGSTILLRVLLGGAFAVTIGVGACSSSTNDGGGEPSATSTGSSKGFESTTAQVTSGPATTGPATTAPATTGSGSTAHAAQSNAATTATGTTATTSGGTGGAPSEPVTTSHTTGPGPTTAAGW